MKKGIAALLCAALLCGLCGCTVTLPWDSGKNTMVMTVSGADVGSDLYAYYLTVLFKEPDKYGVDDPSDEDAVEQAAIRLCTEYVAVNTAFREEGLRLSPAYKKEIAENVSTKWSFYQSYYTSVGITKQTLTQYETCEAKRRQMIAYLYGTGGTQAVSEVEWNANYAVNYVTFRSVNGYLTQTDDSGNASRLPDDKVAQAEDLFRTMCEAVRGGTSLEEVCRANADSPYILSSEPQTVTINRETSNYPPEFFASVQKMDEGAARVIESSDYIFLVVKQSSKQDENLQAHRLACLEEMCRDKFGAYLSAMIEGFHVQKNASALRSLYDDVRKAF